MHSFILWKKKLTDRTEFYWVHFKKIKKLSKLKSILLKENLFLLEIFEFSQLFIL